ncbi:MAG: hypothetical protein JWM64_2224 [Frankiales bacterium]|nr:hypothetical protein [Frankiales bacterium]
MAKALFGHIGASNDLRLAAEVRRLRGRVAELEAELAALRSHADLSVTDDDLRLLTLDERVDEPAFS